MDQAGLELAMLPCPISLGNDPEFFRDATATTRALNDFGGRMVSDYRGRFGPFAGLPLPQIEPTLREIEYAFGVLRADGVDVKTSYGNRWLGDPAFQGLRFETEQGIPLSEHPFYLAARRRHAARTCRAVSDSRRILILQAEFQTLPLAPVLLRYGRILQSRSDAGAEDACRRTANRIRIGLPAGAHSCCHQRT